MGKDRNEKGGERCESVRVVERQLWQLSASASLSGAVSSSVTATVQSEI